MAIDLQLTYAGRTAGGSSTTDLLVGPLVIREVATETLELEAGILLVASDPASFASLEQAARAAYSTPEAAFSVTHGATTIVSGDPASKTAFNVRATFAAEPREEYDSDRSGYYTLRVTCNVPAHSSRAYRREATTSVHYTAARQEVVTLSGTYTAGGGSTALANYQANSGAWISGQLALFGGSSVFEKIDEGPVEQDHDGGLCSFSVRYRRFLYRTGVSGVVNERVTFTRMRTLLANPQRLQVRVSYEGDVDSTVTTDLQSTWNSIASALKTKALAIFGASAYVVESEENALDQTANRITGGLTLLLVGGSYTSRRQAQTAVTYDASRRKRVTFVGVYRTDDAGTDAKAAYDADATTWCNSVLASIDASVTWQLVSEGPLQYDDETAELTFTRHYQQQTWSAGATGVLAEGVTFRRVGAYVHGKTGEVAAIRGVVSYTTSVDRDQSGEATMTLYTGAIRGALLGKLAQLFGGTTVVEREDVAVDPERNAISASLTVLLVGVGSNTITYTESVSIAYNYNVAPQRRYDGKPNSYNLFSGGLDVIASVTATSVTLGTPQLAPFGTQPPAPPAVLGGSSGGRWVVLSGDLSEQSHTLGQAPEGGSTELVVTQTSRVTLLWVDASGGDVTPVGGGVGVPSVPHPEQIGVTAIP